MHLLVCAPFHLFLYSPNRQNHIALAIVGLSPLRSAHTSSAKADVSHQLEEREADDDVFVPTQISSPSPPESPRKPVQDGDSSTLKPFSWEQQRVQDVTGESGPHSAAQPESSVEEGRVLENSALAKVGVASSFDFSLTVLQSALAQGSLLEFRYPFSNSPVRVVKLETVRPPLFCRPLLFSSLFFLSCSR